jgi:predicted Zn-dependent protease
MKKIIFLALNILVSQDVWCGNCRSLEECRQVATDNQYSYLPTYLSDKKIICQSTSNINCSDDVIKEANEILSCREDEKRRAQMSFFDQRQFEVMINDFGAATIPGFVRSLFAKLTYSAEQLSKKQFPWRLSAYNATFINAHAGANSQVMASAGLWIHSPLVEDEIAAILAHEAAHVIKEHSLDLGCLALEWVGAHFELGNAMEAFREDFSISTERGQVWSKFSNNLEYEADEEATRILKAAGFSPMAMARALKKLKPKESGGFSSGSHPEFDERIQAATRHALEVLKE